MSTLSPVLTRTPAPSQTRPQARSQALSIPASSSRTLAVAIEKPETSIAEVLLRYSPRVAVRTVRSSSDITGSTTKMWFFLDLSSHVSWIERTFGDEVQLLENVLKTLSSLGHVARAAIADTPQAAQAFAAEHGFWVSSPGNTRRDLDRLPLTSLLHLEGLEEWSHPSRVDAIVNFFALLGFHALGDLKSFTAAAFHERWGALGDTAFARLQGDGDRDRQPIAPFLPTEPLKSFVHLDYPVSIVSLLLHEVESAMKGLFARLEGRRLVVRRLRVNLRCEYSNQEHAFAIEPSEPTRDLRFFRLLLENRLERIELLNPIKDLEIEIDPLPENERQESFENQATLDQTKLSLLTSLLAQEGSRAGFASLQDDVWPENTWVVNPEASRAAPLPVAQLEASGVFSFAQIRGGQIQGAQGDLDETGFAPKFHYALALEKAPRPALLLKKPRAMERGELSKLQFYSGRPIERIEHGWWEGRAGPPGSPTPGRRRDYFIARDHHGRNLWLFREQNSEQFFLHGAFD